MESRQVTMLLDWELDHEVICPFLADVIEFILTGNPYAESSIFVVGLEIHMVCGTESMRTRLFLIQNLAFPGNPASIDSRDDVRAGGIAEEWSRQCLCVPEVRDRRRIDDGQNLEEQIVLRHPPFPKFSAMCGIENQPGCIPRRSEALIRIFLDSLAREFIYGTATTLENQFLVVVHCSLSASATALFSGERPQQRGSLVDDGIESDRHWPPLS